MTFLVLFFPPCFAVTSPPLVTSPRGPTHLSVSCVHYSRPGRQETSRNLTRSFVSVFPAAEDVCWNTPGNVSAVVCAQVPGGGVLRRLLVSHHAGEQNGADEFQVGGAVPLPSQRLFWKRPSRCSPNFEITWNIEWPSHVFVERFLEHRRNWRFFLNGDWFRFALGEVFRWWRHTTEMFSRFRCSVDTGFRPTCV